MRWGWALAIVCAAGVAHAQAGDAAARQAAREHYQKGTVAYDLGRYDVAIAEYEAAYEAFNEPTLLYNLGQAHKLARHLGQALHFYKMYLVKVPNAPNRAEVETKIAALSAAIEQENRARNAPPDQTIKPPEPTAPTPTSPAAPAPTPPTVTTTEPPPPVAPTERGKGRTFKIAGIVTAAAGLGLVAGGIATGVLSQNAADDISRADAAHAPYDPNKYATYQNDRVASAVLLSVGAAAVVVGTTLVILGVRRDRAPKPLAAANLRF